MGLFSRNNTATPAIPPAIPSQDATGGGIITMPGATEPTTAPAANGTQAAHGTPAANGTPGAHGAPAANGTTPSNGATPAPEHRPQIMAPPKASANHLPPPPPSEKMIKFEQLKVRIHQQLVERLDVQNLRQLPPDTVRAEVRIVIRDLCQSEKGLLNGAEQERLMDEVMDDAFGLGPLEQLLKDPGISDIMVNRSDVIYVEKKGRIERSEVRFRDNAHLRQIIERIVAAVGRRVDETSPMVDARLSDGSRVNAIIPPLALDGPAMSIRRFGSKPMQLEDLIRHGAFPPCVMDFLSAAVQARANILISGGTGSGKTTLLNCLSRYIPAEERVITIEDAAELQLQQPHVVRLETRPMNIEGKGEIGQRELVKNCLRMRPDRIVIGECRGGEALDMLQAMNTGHEGSMTTVHANNTRDALGRLEVMIATSGFDIPMRALRTQVAAAIQIVVQANRLPGGRRKVTKVSEITGMEGETVQMHDLFYFEQLGVNQEGQAIGKYHVTGIRPRFADRIEARGILLPNDLFHRRSFDMME